MHDPFPIPAPTWLSKAIVPIADYLSLPTLPFHIHEVLLTAYFYHIVQSRVSPWLSPKLVGKYYNNFSARTKLNWDVHVVSLVQSVLVCSVALHVMRNDEERKSMTREQRVWGYTGGAGLVQAMGLGYFVWDMYITAKHLSLFGVGMLAHAISALTVFSFGFRPFVNYYGPNFILYELSSPFLNVHWFCDKLDLTGSTIQLVNGIFLITTFISARLLWGTYASLSVFRDVLTVYIQGSEFNATTPATPLEDPATTIPSSDMDVMRYAGIRAVPLWLCGAYALSNITLNCLNWYWINKMIATIRKRFDPPFGTKKAEEKEHVEVDTDVARGAYADGSKSVEVDSTKIRRRPTVQREYTDVMVA